MTTSSMRSVWEVTSESIATRRRSGAGRRELALPPLQGPSPHRLAQLEVRDRTGDRRKPERERAVDEHRDRRQAEVHAERGERPDHASVDAADAARKRQEVAEHPD